MGLCGGMVLCVWGGDLEAVCDVGTARQPAQLAEEIDGVDEVRVFEVVEKKRIISNP